MSNADSRDIVPRPQGGAPTTVPLGLTAAIDLSFLPEDQRNALLHDHARKMLDLGAKAQELGVDTNTLRLTLDQLAATTREVSESGNSVTISHTQTTKIGRTEIKMGNTEEAKSGRMTRSQTGDRDWNPYYIFAGIGALVLIALIFASRH
ncbi:hypothetical protein IQ16_07609 [Bradyrhizobium huanghuaihaiense]|uniref:Uncharacterized protein n=1 Tax=Bradyrhizobium huanghuaihaiense TaxID=990078 RepID=A0A562QUM3_9BRAD|nr:hypothetical protein [Bradyrhizobium huanghuaihaiense]TWI60489.1 hypothetical protein IQ16_07609 [Bradyrhizobium huanghuaihaiense]